MLILSKTLTMAEFSQENVGKNRNTEYFMAIAIWEVSASTYFALEFWEYERCACYHGKRKKY